MSTVKFQFELLDFIRIKIKGIGLDIKLEKKCGMNKNVLYFGYEIFVSLPFYWK